MLGAFPKRHHECVVIMGAGDRSPALFVIASVLYSAMAERYKDATWQRRFQITRN